MSSIEDVAKYAKVSVTTVSRYLNHHPYISEKTKSKIKRAMQVLQYTPNSVAQQLRGKSTKLVGVIVSNLTNQFFTLIVDSIEKELYQAGYQLVVLQTHEEKERELRYLNMLNTKQLDGMIMTTMDNSWETVKHLMQNNVILCNRYVGNDDVPIVKIDEKTASQQGCLYLLEKGYKNIVYCSGGALNAKDLRYDGFLSAFAQREQHYQQKINYNYFSDVISAEDGRRVIDTIFQMTDNRPDAIFANGDTAAAGMLAQVYALGYRVPQDIAILGFDDQPLATLVRPALSTIYQPIEAMGTHAAKLLLAKLKQQEAPAAIDLTTYVVERSST